MASTDWVVIKSIETSVPITPEWAAYRQALRDVTKQLNPFLVAWPSLPVPVPTVGRIYETEPRQEPVSEPLEI